MTQRKYTPEELVRIKDAIDAIDAMPPWCEMSEGRTFWSDVLKKLHDKAKHGTTDGKPWIEPELTDEDALRRPWVKIRSDSRDEWGSFLVRLIYVKRKGAAYRYVVQDPKELYDVTAWNHCRLATPEEIEDANA